MHSFVLVAGVCAVLVWAYLLLARGYFWRVKDKLAAENTRLCLTALVAAVVPARNEADVIRQTILSLLSQNLDPPLHVFLVDDDSSDGTAEAAREAARQISKSDLLTIVQGKPLPSGWSGKLWAIEQGIERAGELSPQFLLLTDADIMHAPDNVLALLGTAEGGKYDLVSLMVKLHCETLSEKLLIPAFVFFFFKLYPPKWIADAQRTTAGAAGGCMLIRPEALARAGGIPAIRGEIIDDCALARRVKLSGGKVWLGLAPSTYSARPYRSFAEIGAMISRTAFNQLHHSVTILAGALLGLVLTYILPIVLLFAGKRAAVFGLLAWLLMTVAYLPMVRFYKLNILWTATLPFAALFYVGATVHSAIRYWVGSGGKWKGRVQDPAIS